MNSVFFIIIILLIVFIISAYFYLFQKPSNDTSIKDLYAEGLDMLVTGKRKSAYRNFKEIINQDSNNVKAYLHLGQVLREGKNIQRALKIHTNLLYRTDLSIYEKIELYKNLVFDYEKLNNNSQAINYCNKLLELDNKNEWAIKYLIKLYKNQDDWVNAISSLKLYFKLKNKDDDHMLGLYNIQMGRSLLKQSKYNDAREIFEKAINLDNELYIAYYFIGNSLKEESNYVFEKAQNLKNQTIESLENNEKEKIHIKEAEKLLNKAILMWVHFIEDMPEYSWLILATLEDALQALDRYDDIENILIKIKDKNSNNIDIISHLADFYANKGEIDKALITITSALEKNPDSLIGQLKKVKIQALKKGQKDISTEVDKLIYSLLSDDRYKKYKYKFKNNDLHWLFEINEGDYE